MLLLSLIITDVISLFSLLTQMMNLSDCVTERKAMMIMVIIGFLFVFRKQ